jgi:hypothetical protein
MSGLFLIRASYTIVSTLPAVLLIVSHELGFSNDDLNLHAHLLHIPNAHTSCAPELLSLNMFITSTYKNIPSGHLLQDPGASATSVACITRCQLPRTC